MNYPFSMIRSLLPATARAVLGALAVTSGVAAAAEPDGFEMDEIIVTGTRDHSLWETPRSATVITAADIERAGSGSLVDLLAREANVNLRSFFGNDKFAGVDVRGMGDTFVSNVLILVDGVRMNAVDLSGADFSSIPLDQIERVEIVRGANAVRYGSGAVGGVINIRTRRYSGTPRASTRLAGGSFDTWTGSVSGAGGSHGASARIDATVHDTNGHRDNGGFYKKDGALELRYEHQLGIDAHVRGSLHEDRYGIPGPISAAAFAAGDSERRATNAPLDAGRTMDRNYRAGLDVDLGRWGQFSGLARHRNRTNPFIIGFSGGLPADEQLSTIESVARNYEATWTVPWNWAGYDHELVLGYEDQSADYERREMGRGLVDRSRALAGNIDSRGGFVSSRWSLPYAFDVDLGYRRDSYRLSRHEQALREVCDTEFVDTTVTTTVFVTVAPGIVIPIPLPVTVSLPIQTNCRGELQITPRQNETWRNEAWEAGLNYQPREWVSAYLSYHRSFRNPNVDELTLATDDLGPQRGTHWELGVRLRQRQQFEAALALFHMQVDDEIFFGFDVNSGRSLNINLADGTTRMGVELELKAQLVNNLRSWINASYIDARFSGSDAFIPLVPRDKLAAGITWQALPRLSLSGAVTYTGARYDGNDFDNDAFARLDPYKVVDFKVHWQGSGYALGAAVNNVTDEVYSTVGFSETYYPMPRRNFMLELSLEI